MLESERIQIELDRLDPEQFPEDGIVKSVLRKRIEQEKDREAGKTGSMDEKHKYTRIEKPNGAYMESWTDEKGYTVITGDCPICKMFPCEHNDVSLESLQDLAEQQESG